MSNSIVNTKVVTIKQAIDSFLLSCKVEAKSYGTFECYADNLKGFLWYATNYHWPNDIKAITTDYLREFLAYLRESPSYILCGCISRYPCGSASGTLPFGLLVKPCMKFLKRLSFVCR